MDEKQTTISVQQELDPVMETLGLIYLVNRKDTFRDEWIEEINQYGINGELFYDKHVYYLNEYVAEFEKYYISHPDVTFFLGARESDFFIMISYIILLNRDWLTSFDNVTEEMILSQLLPLLSNKVHDSQKEVSLYSLRTTDKFIAYLEQCDLDERTKWQVLKIFCSPKEVFSILISIINDNLPAFEKAYKTIYPKIAKLVESFSEAMKNPKYPAYKSIVEGLHYNEVKVYPSLVFPESLLAYRNHIYYGLVIDAIPLQSDTPEELRDYLLMRLKSLSDLSKLQIMMLLKQGDKYNLEIAEQIGVTAATASHHMNVLLSTGLIGIYKQNGKVYYHLEKDEIKKLIEKLEQYLL